MKVRKFVISCKQFIKYDRLIKQKGNGQILWQYNWITNLIVEAVIFGNKETHIKK